MPQVYDIFKVTEKEIHGMTGEEFEDLIGDFYKLHNYEVFSTPKTNDYGADLILKSPSGVICVQTKRQTSNVGIKAVQEVYASMAKYGGVSGVVITTAGFSAQCLELAKHCGIRLINGSELWKYITDIQNKKFVFEENKNLLRESEEFLKNKETYLEYINQLEAKTEILNSTISKCVESTSKTENNSKIICNIKDCIKELHEDICGKYKEIIQINAKNSYNEQEKQSTNNTLNNIDKKVDVNIRNIDNLNNEIKDLKNKINSDKIKFNILYCLMTAIIIGGVILTWN